MIAELHAAIDTALAARDRLRDRPIYEIAGALAAAAQRWRDDDDLARELPAAAHLGDAMVRAVLPLVAEQLDADALVDLHAREAAGTGPALVAHVLASNVPGLALPAIALGCLAGAAVLVKSGRADPLSAPAFHRALRAVDPELAATVVPAYWRGGTRAAEDALLARADVVCASGSDVSVATLARRFGARVVAHGSRSSFAVSPGDVPDATVDALAWDVVRYEQRGCLSPHAVFVLGDADALGRRLLASLDARAREVPPPPPTTAERAAHRLALEEARFAGATVHEAAHGTVIVGHRPRLDEGVGRRTVLVQAIAGPGEIVDAFAPGTIECVGAAGDVALDAAALRERGVARICPVGRMQRPRIDWPRGQRPALGSLFRTTDERRIQVEA